jgi:hypothetical protein
MFLVGADPELFVKQGDRFLSGHLFPCGTKAVPTPTKHGAVQVDGIALEFNVKPSATRSEFITNLKNVLGDLNEIVDRHYPGAKLESIPTAEVGMEFLNSLPEINRELGCNPDYNAYSLGQNPSPNAQLPFRTGSGHVHIGFKEFDESLLESREHFEYCARIARQLDFFLGLPSLSWDTDSRRRELYGQAGAFRPKPYGLEYRVLSNKWVDDEYLVGFVYDQTEKAMNLIEQNYDLTAQFGGYARESINSGNTGWLEDRPDIAEAVLA